MKSYRLVKGEKNIRITVNMPHSHQDGWAPGAIGMFIDECLKNGTPLLQVAIKDQQRMTVRHAERLRSATIHSTVETGPINKRKWTSDDVHFSRDIPGVIELIPSRGVILEILKYGFTPVPDTATGWFITVTDDRGATVSSEATIKK